MMGCGCSLLHRQKFTRVFSAIEGGAMNTCLLVLKGLKRNKMDSELLLKFIEYFPDYLSVLSRTPLRCFWTTFVETAVLLYISLLTLIVLTCSFLVTDYCSFLASMKRDCVTLAKTTCDAAWHMHIQAVKQFMLNRPGNIMEILFLKVKER